MSSTYAASSSRQHAIRMENNVWCLFGRFPSSHRLVWFYISFRRLHIDAHPVFFFWVDTERVANSAFELVQRINKEHFSHVIRYGAFADLTVCMTDFCKVNKYQKISLQAVEMLRGVVPAMLACPDCALNLPQKQLETDEESGIVEAPPVNDPMVKFWFPLLFAFYDVVMNGEDLEVRRVWVFLVSQCLGFSRSSHKDNFFVVHLTPSLTRLPPTGLHSDPISGIAFANKCCSRSLLPSVQDRCKRI